MKTSIYDAKTTLNNSGFLAAMEKAREATDKSIGMMNALGESISGLGVKFTSLSQVETFTKGIKDAMEQGRQFAVRARQASPSLSTMVELQRVFQNAGVVIPDQDTKKSARKAAPLDHFKAPDADRFAKVGLFIGGAPQTPGLSEAKRTAVATEKTVKSLGQLIDVTLKSLNGTGGMTYAE
jgi:hypothetical protein